MFIPLSRNKFIQAKVCTPKVAKGMRGKQDKKQIKQTFFNSILITIFRCNFKKLTLLLLANYLTTDICQAILRVCDFSL